MNIKSKRVLLDGKFKEAVLVLADGVIKDILPYECDAIDYGSNYIVPGFIDIHTHGGYGYSLMSNKQNDVYELRGRLLEEGVTSILATTTSLEIAELEHCLHRLGYEIAHEGCDGRTRIVGIHQEGPFLDVNFRGSQKKECLIPASVSLFKQLQKCSNDSIKRVTLASEHDEHHALIKYLCTKGIVASNGHTSADIEEAKEAFTDGVQLVTHFYNGMDSFSPRAPGLIGATLLSKHAYCEVIGDGIHVHMDAIQLLYNNIGSKRMILITDANKAKGMPAGEYNLEGRNVVVDVHGAARIKETGKLAGSTAKLNECIRNVIKGTTIPIEEVFDFVSKNPARLLNLHEHLGELKVGYDADITVLNDEFQVVDTFVKGIHKRP